MKGPRKMPKKHVPYRRSRQRERILELLQSTEAHPTASWLYARLRKEFARLSLGTVYRNIGVLIEQGLVSRIAFGSTFDRLDAGEKGSADTVRDPRGFAIKFYTEDGNYDLVGNNTPIFFLRDPLKFPDFIHSQKRDPYTNVQEPDNV